MSVAEQILAELALTEDEPPPCHFMRLPIEIRKKIYALLLLAPPVPRVHCSISAHTKQCSPGGRFFSSTCKPTSTVIRTLGCGTCEWRGGDVHTAILAVNHSIYEEASDVLYEHTQMVYHAGSPMRFPDDLGAQSLGKIRRIVFTVLPINDFLFPSTSWWASPGYLTGLKIVELHIDIDLTKFIRLHITPETSWLTIIPGLEIVVNVHIICAWEEDESGWDEPIVSRHGNEARALELDEQAKQLRLGFIQDLEEVFRARDKKLVIREN